MHRAATWTFVALLSIGCGATRARPVVVTEESATQGIQVTGRGEIRAAPDLAVLDIGVEAQRPTVAEAREEASIAQTAVLAALRGSGIAREDVQTTELTIRPEYEHSETGRNLLGYVVSNSVQVRVRQLDRIQEVVDTAVTAGGDRVRLRGLQFELSDPEAVQVQARERAIADARAEALQIADQLGVALGEPLSVEEVSTEPVRPMAMRMEQADVGGATPIEPGTSEITVELRVRWAIGAPTSGAIAQASPPRLSAR